MSLVLYPRAAPNDRLRVWVGAFQATQAPALSWLLDGNAFEPSALRPMSSVRSGDLFHAGTDPATVPRAFSGVYEFAGLLPDTTYEVSVTGGGESMVLSTRTLPAAVPTQLDRSFNVLLISCFHQAEDRAGLAGTIVSQLKATAKPNLTILAGDQVYLDLPTLQDFPDNKAWLAEKFEQDYTLNWSGPLAYTEVLSVAPAISCPDDHEFWNNYPHVSPMIGNSRTPEGRQRWKEAATAMFEGFQLAYPASLGEAVTIDVHPLSFFVADTRSKKDEHHGFTMSPEARTQLSDWVTDVIAQKRFGVFVSGQSLFGDAAGTISGYVGDYELANYGDYGEIVSILRRLVDAGRPVLCLTGDVHWGRVSTARDVRTGRIGFAEVISSPASLVSFVGMDQAKRFFSAIGGLFGQKNPWPRHADPAAVPSYLASGVLQGGFPCTQLYGHRGNHVAMLSFRQHGTGVEMRARYWPITRDAQIGRPIEVAPIELVNS